MFAWPIKSLYADGKCQWIECEQEFEDFNTFQKYCFNLVILLNFEENLFFILGKA